MPADRLLIDRRSADRFHRSPGAAKRAHGDRFAAAADA
jgi:hypothetical protein